MINLKLELNENEEEVAHELLRAYLTWLGSNLKEKYGLNNYSVENVYTKDLQLCKQDKDTSLYLITNANEPVGIILLRFLKEAKKIEIKRFFINPLHRKKGFAKQSLTALFLSAKKQGFKEIILETCTFMESAHRLYYDLGFEKTLPYENNECPKELQFIVIFMHKRI